MGKYIHFTEEQKQRANSVDLVEFLIMQGETLLSSGREKRLQSNHSITVRGNEWFDHATKGGGLAIDFVQNFYGLSFPDAVTILLNGEQGIAYPKATEYEKNIKPFELPPRNSDMRRVFAYLIKHRLIDHEVLSFFVKEKLVYESKERPTDGSKEYHNAIFVGYDKNGVPKHAHKRGLYTKGESYKGNVESSNPGYSFHYIGKSNRLYVFEAPIDLLSFITIHNKSDWKRHSYIALCGLSEQALFKTLNCNPKLKHVALCLDHDVAGIEAIEKFEDMLVEKEISSIRLMPNFKDWNEDLKARQGFGAVSSEKHPQHELKHEFCEEILQIVEVMALKDIGFFEGENILIQAQVQNENQAEAIKLASAIFLCLALKEHRQLDNHKTAADVVQSLCAQFRAYQNRSRFDPTLADATDAFSKVNQRTSNTATPEKMDIADVFQKVALALLKSLIQLEMLNQKQIQAPSIKMD